VTDSLRIRGTRWDKRLYVGMLIFYAVLFAVPIFAAGMSDVGISIFAVLTIGLLLIAWRGVPVGQIWAGDLGVSAFGYLRRWHWTWDQLSGFTVEDKMMPFAGTQRRTFVVHTADGATTTVKAVNSSLRGTRWADDGVVLLNAELAKRRGGLPEDW
jgi:hypothetical protein